MLSQKIIDNSHEEIKMDGEKNPGSMDLTPSTIIIEPWIPDWRSAGSNISQVWGDQQ